jgi:uncharacterized metal-binding protein YceD (DUF177 family)
LGANLEFSRRVTVERLPAAGLSVEIEADRGELEALARRLELHSLSRLAATGLIEPRGSGLISVGCAVEATLEQICTVTLEPFAVALEFSCERLFSLEPMTAPDQELELDPLATDVEPLEKPVLDLGEIVAEELALNIEPYPRSPMAEAAMEDIRREAAKSGPFASLESLRKRGT